VRKGEPLSRIVVNIDGLIFELDQLDSQLPDIRSTRISFNFHRNRITNPRARFLFENGRSLGAEGKHAEARELFLEARKIDPYDPYFPYEQGLAEMYLKNFSVALSCFQETQKLAPGWFHVIANIKLAQLLAAGVVDHDTFKILHVVEDGNLTPPQKVVVCQKILEQAQLPIAHLHLGQALQQLRRLDEAKRALEAGLQLAENLDDDVKTRLLFQLATACPDGKEKTRLLDEAIACGGNLTCKAMATVTKIIDARKDEGQ
jgi:tetratricopeptide (TPR) repeat protein